MMNQADQTWAILQEAGIVQGERPETSVSGSPWYVKVLLAFSGWLAAVFILGFIAIAFEFILSASSVAFVFGVIMVGAAFALLRGPSGDFVEHLGLAVSLAGQVLMVYAIFDIFDHFYLTVWGLLAILQAALVAIMPNFVHRVFSSFVGAMAFLMALNEIHMPYFAGGVVMFGASFCWLNEFSRPEQMDKIRAVGYGLVLALIALECTFLFGYRFLGIRFIHAHQGFWAHPWFGEGLIGGVALYVVWNVLQRYEQPLSGRLSMVALAGTLLVCAVSMRVQGITAGMVILCFGFLGGNRVLLGLGTVALLFFISSYYYLLDTTLLNKSGSLLLVGLVLLCVRWLMHRIIPIHSVVHTQ